MIFDELCGSARLLVHLAKMDGHDFDKKVTRFNDIAELAMTYGSMGDTFRPEIARDSLRECVRYCIIGDPMHYPGSGQRDAIKSWQWAVTCNST